MNIEKITTGNVSGEASGGVVKQRIEKEIRGRRENRWMCWRENWIFYMS